MLTQSQDVLVTCDYLYQLGQHTHTYQASDSVNVHAYQTRDPVNVHAYQTRDPVSALVYQAADSVNRLAYSTLTPLQDMLTLNDDLFSRCLPDY